MEINAEINKVFGQEMAKLFADQISEEELKAVSRESWKEITSRPLKWGDRQPSKLDNMLQTELVDRLLEKTQKIMKEEVSEEWIQQEAEKIATEAKELAHKLIVNEIANNIGKSMFYNYDIGYELNKGCGEIAKAIANRR